ncbi:MAG: hypothetical protein LBK41_08860 [Clostridiales bacterium]|jgi:hypothetical protein|nr:hypothetical protein [Clostridiales bacterium]
MLSLEGAEKTAKKLRERLGVVNPLIAETVGDAALDDIRAVLPRLRPKHARSLALMIKVIEIEQLIEAYRSTLAAVRTGRDFMATSYDSFIDDPAFDDLEPEQLEFLADLAERVKGKSALEAASILMSASSQLPRGRELTRDERTTMISAFLNSMPEPDRAKFQRIFSLVGLR